MKLLRTVACSLAIGVLAFAAGAVPIGDLDLTFQDSVGANGTVWSIAVDANQRILIGGEFTSYGGVQSHRLARLNGDGSLDTTFSVGAGANGTVHALAIQSDGRIVIVGTFTSFAGVSRSGIARVNDDGSLDSSFDPGDGAVFPAVFGLALQADDKPVLGGVFTQYAGSVKPRVARALTTGANDGSFVGSANDIVHSVAVQPDGKILVGGLFTKLNGANRHRIGRYNANGTIDSTFVGSAGGEVNAIEVQADGRVLLGGYAGPNSGLLGRLLSGGQPDASFSCSADGAVWALRLQSDGKVLVGGEFAHLAGAPRGRLGRLNVDGSIDMDFIASPGANSIVLAITTQPDGRILIGGMFTSYNGVGRGRVARILPASSCYADQDGDGFGAGAPTGALSPCGPGFSTLSGDCDDTRSTVHPGAPEICDGLDNDCDGGIDEGVAPLFFRDADGDGFGTPLDSLAACTQPAGHVSNDLDCDDTRANVHAGAPELCDGLDNDCDGQVDQPFLESYCTAGTSVAGCMATISSSGAPSSSSLDSFDLQVSGMPGQRMGAIFYGLGATLAAWAQNSSSLLCVLPPQQRLGSVNSGGTAGECDGSLSTDFNAFLRAHPAALGAPFSVGTTLYAQSWYRDPGAPRGTHLSNALKFTICH